MKVTLKIKMIETGKREVTIISSEGTYSSYYTNTNAIFPLYKELIYFCRNHQGAELDIYSNSVSFITDLKHLESSNQRLSTMLKDTLSDCACSIKSVAYLTR